MKQCSRCRSNKPHSEFSRNKAQRDGYQNCCNMCMKAANDAWRAANPDKVRESGRAWRLANRERCRENQRKWMGANRDRDRARRRAKYAENPEKFREKRRLQVFRQFGITKQDYLVRLASQAGVCAICHKPPTSKRLHIDHSHATGEVRQLLCAKCNTAPGLANDSPELLRSMADYLDAHNPKEKSA